MTRRRWDNEAWTGPVSRVRRNNWHSIWTQGTRQLQTVAAIWQESTREQREPRVAPRFSTYTGCTGEKRVEDLRNDFKKYSSEIKLIWKMSFELPIFPIFVSIALELRSYVFQSMHLIRTPGTWFSGKARWEFRSSGTAHWTISLVWVAVIMVACAREMTFLRVSTVLETAKTKTVYQYLDSPRPIRGRE